MNEMWINILNIFGTDLLPVFVPLLIYWIYSNRKPKIDLKGRVVLITGASSGLGEALAQIFYKAGCKLILAARRVDQLERVKADLLNTNVDEAYLPVVFPLDLSKLETIPEKASEMLAVYNKIDILINNAGISFRGSILETDLEVHTNVMTVNYFGQISLTKALLPSLIKCKGHVVAISSVQSRISLPYRSAYAASKNALQAFMDCLRSEVDDIKVTVINPGYVNTNLSVNAITGTGEKYGDATTANGYSPEYVAQKILSAVTKGDKEVTISPFLPKIAILFRVISPSLFFYVIKFWVKKNK